MKTDPYVRATMQSIADRFDTPEEMHQFFLDRADDLYTQTGIRVSVRDGILRFNLTDFKPSDLAKFLFEGGDIQCS